MAGEIQLNSTTFATESAGTITVSNVDSATNRTNLGLGSIATQEANSVDIDGGVIDGATIGGSSAAAGTFTTFTSTGIDDNASSTALTIDSSGNLLVGTATTETRFGFTPELQVEGTGTNAGIAVARYSNDNTGPVLIFSKSNGTSVGSDTIVAANGILGAIYFAGADGTDQSSTGASIVTQVDGTPGLNDMPGRLVFATTADGASSPTERMRIDSSGNVLVGDEIDGNGHTFRNTAGKAGLNIYRASASTSAEIFNGYSNVVSTENKRFTVYTDGDIASGTGASPTTYSSDIRTKENVIDASGKLSDLLRLRVVNFNFIGSVNKFIGFIAHEFEEVFPSLVTEHDTRKYDDNGNLVSGFEDTKRIRVGMEFAIFTKAIQEQQAIIESQQSQIDALTARIEALETA